MGNININEALKNDHNEIKKVKTTYANLRQNFENIKHISQIEKNNMESVEKRKETVSIFFNRDTILNIDRKKLEEEFEQQVINTHTTNKFKG